MIYIFVMKFYLQTQTDKQADRERERDRQTQAVHTLVSLPVKYINSSTFPYIDLKLAYSLLCNNGRYLKVPSII